MDSSAKYNKKCERKWLEAWIKLTTIKQKIIYIKYHDYKSSNMLEQPFFNRVQSALALSDKSVRFINNF